MKTSNAESSLRIYAKLLAIDPNFEVHIGGTKAYATPEKVQIPNLPLNEPWGQICSTGFVMHEVGHKNHTQFDDWPTIEPLRTITNWFEDVRMERKLKVTYAGAHQRLARLVEELVKREWFVAADEDGSLMNRVSAWAIFWGRAKLLGQTAVADLALDAERKCRDLLGDSLADDILALFQRNERATCTKDCVELAKELIQLISTQETPDEKSEEGATSADKGLAPGEAGDDGTKDDHSASGSSGTNKNAEPPKASGAVQGGAKGSCATGNQGAEQQQAPQGGCGNSVGGREGIGVNQQSSEQRKNAIKKFLGGTDLNGYDDLGHLLEQILESIAAKPGGVRIKPSKIIKYHGMQQVETDLIRATAATASALQSGLLRELIAQDRVGIINVRHGTRIDSRRIPRMAMGNPKVFMQRVEKPKLNTAVQVLLDRSFSTRQEQRLVRGVQATFALADALASIPRIRTSVGVFPCQEGLSDDCVGIVSEFDEPVRRKASTFAAVTPDGDTPMAEALFGAGLRLMGRNEDRKLLVVITDGKPCKAGLPDETSRSNARYMVRELEAEGIELIAIGIGIDVTPVFPGAIKIDSADQLPRVLFGAIEQKLLALRAA